MAEKALYKKYAVKYEDYTSYQERGWQQQSPARVINYAGKGGTASYTFDPLTGTFSLAGGGSAINPSQGRTTEYKTTNLYYVVPIEKYVWEGPGSYQGDDGDTYTYRFTVYTNNSIPVASQRPVKGDYVEDVVLDKDSVEADTENEDGYWYEFVRNCYAPSAPPNLSVPNLVYSGKTISVSWSASSDEDGNLEGYLLERKTSGAYVQIYKGTDTSFADSVLEDWQTVQYRVCAYDADQLYSGYTESTERTVNHNHAPQISTSAESNLGLQTEGFTISYTVLDEDEDNVLTVTESIDGEKIRSYDTTNGQEQVLNLTGNQWITVLNGNHILTISAADNAGGLDERTFTFSKKEDTIQFALSTPLSSEEDTLTRAIGNLVGQIPVGSEVTIELCNNANDSSPVWEDATEECLEGIPYEFQNQTKTAEKWGFNIRVTIARGDQTGECYLQSVGGAFE